MFSRLRLWVGISLAVITTAALVVPGSPVYLPRILVGSGGYHDGHHTRYWIDSLGSPDALVRCAAAHALGAIGPEASEAVPLLGRVLCHDTKRGPRIEASLALLKMAPAIQTVVTELTGALGDRDPLVRMNAVAALSRLGAAARPAIPALVKAVNNKSNQKNLGMSPFNIRERAALALGRVSAGSVDAVPALTAALLEAHTHQMRLAAVSGLGYVGPPARAAAPLLHALLQDRSSDMRECAKDALLKIEAK